MKQKRLAVDEAERLVREGGLTQAEAARRAGCTQSAVTKRFWTPEQKERARRQNLARNDKKRAWERQQRAERAAERRAARLRVPEVPGVLWIRSYGDRIVGKALVDLEDWQRFKHLRFHLQGKGYPATQPGGRAGRPEYLHRLIFDLKPGERWADGQRKVVDHINRDLLDNRRANLRVQTQKENCANRGGIFEKAAA